jgi:serine/threonine-protein kinase
MLAAGTRLATFEIIGLIGQGGMGEVYRARDLTLRRDVALKILPPLFATDTDRRARFTREAQILASLNHPHIATIHGLENAEGVTALVLELVEGPTLADCLAEKAFSLDDALRVALQITAALDAAHEKGIIHRDLKPANIKLTADDRVKVLDFGLAKALADDSAPADAAVSPTITAVASRLGVILGTAAYMSPEQARGKPIDKRIDIWAFGCVLYELLARRKAFPGDHVTDVIVSVLTTEPDWTALPTSTPPRLVELVRRCLRKDPRERLRDIGDARFEVERLLHGDDMREGVASDSRSRETRAGRLIRAGALLGLGLIAGVLITAVGPLRPTTSTRSPGHFLVPLPADEGLAGLDFPAVAMSPDASLLAYVGTRGGHTQLFLRSLNSVDPTPIAGTNNALSPFFSPDSRWLGFFADGQLKKIEVARGGSPITLCDAPVGLGANWGRDDTIVFAGTTGSGLSQVLAAGGRPQRLTTLDSRLGEFSHRWPELLPDGDTVLFTAATEGSWDDAQIVAQSRTSGKRSLLVQGGTNPHYLRSGHLLYAHGGAIMAVRFDAASATVIGTPVRVLSGVLQSLDGAAQFSVSSSGSVVYVAGSLASDQRRLVAVDRGGAVTPLAAPQRPYASPRVSPDGQRLLVTIEDRTTDIWMYDISSGSLAQVTFDAGATFPIWTPDGRGVVFSARSDGQPNLFSMPVSHSAATERLANSKNLQLPGSFSPDGATLAFVDRNPTTNRDIWLMQVGAARAARPWINTAADEGAPRISPDGRAVAYVSNESGRSEVYVAPYADPAHHQRASSMGGSEPVWARNGAELFYREGSKVMAVPMVRDGGGVRAAIPRPLFESTFEMGTLDSPNFDVMPDGQRFVMVQEQTSGRPTLHMLIDWLGAIGAPAGSTR